MKYSFTAHEVSAALLIVLKARGIKIPEVGFDVNTGFLIPKETGDTAVTIEILGDNKTEE